MAGAMVSGHLVSLMAFRRTVIRVVIGSVDDPVELRSRAARRMVIGDGALVRTSTTVARSVDGPVDSPVGCRRCTHRMLASPTPGEHKSGIWQHGLLPLDGALVCVTSFQQTEWDAGISRSDSKQWDSFELHHGTCTMRYKLYCRVPRKILSKKHNFLLVQKPTVCPK